MTSNLQRILSFMAILYLTLACGKTSFNSKAKSSADPATSGDVQRNAADQNENAVPRIVGSQSTTNNSDEGSEDEPPSPSPSPTATATAPSGTLAPSASPGASALACLAHDSVVSMMPSLVSDLLAGVSFAYTNTTLYFKALNPDPGSIALMDFSAAQQACVAIGGIIAAPDYYILLGQHIRSQLIAPASGDHIGVWAVDRYSNPSPVDLLDESSLPTCVKHLVICKMPH